MIGRIDEAPDGGGDQHPGCIAERYNGPDQTSRLAMRLQKYADKRADTGLHVGHKEVQTKQRPKPGRRRGQRIPFAGAHGTRNSSEPRVEASSSLFSRIPAAFLGIRGTKYRKRI
jgi:hypothetical protein